MKLPLDQTAADLDDWTDETAAFCGCSSAIVSDRMCVLCNRPNLEAMVLWHADRCACSVPADSYKGIKLRSCRTCDKPVFGSS